MIRAHKLHEEGIQTGVWGGENPGDVVVGVAIIGDDEAKLHRFSRTKIHVVVAERKIRQETNFLT